MRGKSWRAEADHVRAHVSEFLTVSGNSGGNSSEAFVIRTIKPDRGATKLKQAGLSPLLSHIKTGLSW
eukprot:9194920-Pyramimonas_sp.AAC.1